MSKEWPMCNRALTVSSFLFVRGQTIHFNSLNFGNILYNLFSGNSSNDFPLEQETCLRAKSIPRNSAVYIELLSGSRQVKGLLIRLVDTAAAATPSSVLEPSVKMFSNKGYSEISCK